MNELDGFREGYKKLQSYDFIDQQNVFIFGHSLGGTVAPLLAEEFVPKGVIVYGTTLKSWHDYLIDLYRFQSPATGMDYATMEDSLASYRKTYHEYFINKKSPKDLIQNKEHIGALFNGLKYDGDEMILSRHYSFWQELNDVNLVKSWKNTSSFVLAIYGESDFAALYPDAHQQIVSIVNHYHPAKGKYLFLPETNHMMYKVGNMEEFLTRRAEKDFDAYQSSRFNFELVNLIHGWMTGKLKEKI